MEGEEAVSMVWMVGSKSQCDEVVDLEIGTYNTAFAEDPWDYSYSYLLLLFCVYKGSKKEK